MRVLFGRVEKQLILIRIMKNSVAFAGNTCVTTSHNTCNSTAANTYGTPADKTCTISVFGRK